MKARNSLLRILRYVPLLLALMLATVFLRNNVETTEAQSSTMQPLGMVCTESRSGTFNLTTAHGNIVQPDGNVVYMWGFSKTGDPFQHPGPILCVDEGDEVTVILRNTLNEDVSIVFPGQENVMANGQPSQPVFNGVEMVSMAPVAAANGGTMTYNFTAGRPGTYLYQSGTEPTKQVDMGLFGVLVVRPSGVVTLPDNTTMTLPTVDAYGEPIAYAYNDANAAYNPSTEYILIISEIDPELHVAVEAGYTYDMNQYKPRYWMYNGRGFPDTLADNGSTLLTTQPYGSLVYYHPYDDQPYQLDENGNPVLDDGDNPIANINYNPYPTLLRIVNAGMMKYTHHPHGNHGRIIGRDGNLLAVEDGGTIYDMSYEKFAVTLGPGQTADALYRWVDTEKWHPTENPIPVTIPQLQDLAVGQWYSGSPYLGNLDALPVGTQAFNQCGEYYHLAHNHALHQITSWGVVLSGSITFARIDPPLPNACP